MSRSCRSAAIRSEGAQIPREKRFRPLSSITVNDGSGPRTVLLNSEFHNGAWVSFPINVAAGGSVTIAVNHEAGPNAVLSGVFLGETGAPPSNTPQELSKGGWVGSFGAGGYDLAGWDGPTGDVSYIPNATVSLVQGSRYQWAANTTDARALSEPEQETRNAAAYYDPNQIQVKLSFTAAYSGNLHLYAVDWDTTARRETISVNWLTATLANSFNGGAWGRALSPEGAMAWAFRKATSSPVSTWSNGFSAWGERPWS